MNIDHIVVASFVVCELSCLTKCRVFPEYQPPGSLQWCFPHFSPTLWFQMKISCDEHWSFSFLLFLWYVNPHASRNIVCLLNISGIAAMVLPIIFAWRTVVSNHGGVEAPNLRPYLTYKYKSLHVKISAMVSAVERRSIFLFNENVRWLRKHRELLCVGVWCAWLSSQFSSFVVGTNTWDFFHHVLHHLYLQTNGFKSNVRVW